MGLGRICIAEDMPEEGGFGVFLGHGEKLRKEYLKC